MSNLRYQIFYRKYGVRLPQQVMSPMMHDLSFLDLPMKSVYHYVTFDGIELGPPADEFLFRNIRKPIFVGNVSEIGDSKGNPRRLAINENNLLREYRGLNRRIRPLRDITIAGRDPQTLVVYNYCFIPKMYKYIRSFYTEYFKWYNIFAAVTRNMAKVAEEIDNQQFLVLGVPKIIPSLSQLNLASKNLTQTLMKVFKDANAYTLIEIWKWLGEERDQSLFSIIPKNKLHLINLVFQESGKWTVVNLGVLNSYRALEENETEDDYVIKSNIKLNKLQLQKRFLRFIMKVTETRTEALKEESTEIETNDQALQDTEQVDSVNDTPDTGEDRTRSVPLNEISINTSLTEEHEDSLTDLQLEETESDYLERIEKEDLLLDEELEQLNEIALKHETEEDTEVETSTVKEILEEKSTTLEEGVMNLCDRLADEGLITAGEYKRFNDLSQQYKVISSPYLDAKGKTISEYIAIKPEELLIDSDKEQFTDNVSVLDKTMLRSSLEDFDRKYITEVLNRHTVSMVTAIQQAGIAVTDYNIETNTDILGTVEFHSVKLIPVEGAPTTINFKIPKIDEDGSFTVNNVKYALRKQKSDLPIRKISSNRVALTSYYGKTFINRGRKRAHDYGNWLQSKVMVKALDKEDPDIKSFLPADVFDPDLNCARSYSALAMSYKEIQARGYTIYLDQREVKNTVPEFILNQFSQNGNLVIGTNGKDYLVLDLMGSVYTTKGNQLELFGTLEQFLNIVNDDAPVEFAELVVFGKEIPMGIVLSYYLGFTNLLKILKVNPRRIESGTRVTLGQNEYALSFSDETLVFSRDDRLAAIILGGFQDYHRIIKQFSVYSFDKRGVYLNILEANKLSVRYLREIDLMNNMFIDPITKQLLEEMNEPQTFQGLLFRACELLLDDKHPDELDPRYMRIKGYERVPGAIYSELVQMLRVHNGSLGRKTKRLDLNPYAVWKKITEDPAKMQKSEINPIQALKETEAVTYAGVGGRNKRSMTKSTRAYHKNDMGVISESTVDSSDVAINTFMSANPKFKSVLGIATDFDINKDGPTSLFSTSALMAPCSDQDDQ